MLEVQSRLILSLVYILILPFFALLFKSKREAIKKGWSKWKIKSDNLEDLKNQF